jgi:hypothetical protein
LLAIEDQLLDIRFRFSRALYSFNQPDVELGFTASFQEHYSTYRK